MPEVQPTALALEELPHEIAICQPIMRFLQLLCENHNSQLQVNSS